MSLWTRRTIVIVIACSLSVSASSATNPTAIVSPRGQVKLNGAIIHRSLAVLDGDDLATDKDSTATLVTQGLTARVSPESHVRYRQHGLELLVGCSQITAVQAATVAVARMEILANQQGSNFVVYRRGGKILIGVVTGRITVAGLRKQELAAGETFELDEESGVSSPVNGKQEPSPAAAGTRATHNHELLAFLVGAAAVGGVLFYNSNQGSERTPISPR